MEVIAFSGTKSGKKVTSLHRSRPQISVERDCPTLISLPWYEEKTKSLIKLCSNYARRTSKGKFALGYCQTGALLVFEHGCPNNAPAIIWAPTTTKKSWMPLFPDRTVLPEEKSVFPLEIARRDPLSVLVEAGMSHLLSSKSTIQSRPSPLSIELIVMLGLLSKRITDPASLSFAIGLSNNECTEMLENCISWGLITATFRLTQLARRELNTLKANSNVYGALPSLGPESYYPKSLRSHSGG